MIISFLEPADPLYEFYYYCSTIWGKCIHLFMDTPS